MFCSNLPLLAACRINNWEAVNTLVLDPRCTEQVVNKKDDWGYTPVMEALKFGSKDSLRVLATTPTVHFYIEDLMQVATSEGLQVNIVSVAMSSCAPCRGHVTCYQ